MKKNDITYEYRVFTHRPIDVESMEVGRCTSKVLKELKEKDKVDGRFFHTTDTDEWFLCWNGKLQKLDLKGSADVDAALAEVKKLIADANVAVEEAKKTAGEAKDAADAAKDAADNATAAVESIDKLEEAVASKADKGDVEAVANEVKTKQDAIDDLSEIRTNANLAKTALQEVPAEYVTETELAGMNYATITQVNAKQDIISDLETIRSGAAAGATALQSIPDNYITDEKLSGKGFATTEYVGQQIEKIEIPTNVSVFTNDAGYLTKDVADGYYAALGTTGSDDGVDKNYVDAELAKKQNIIDDIDDIRSKANSALQSIPEDYITSEELESKGYLTAHQDISGKQNVISDLDTIRSGAALGATALQAIPSEYVTETELDDKGYLTEQSLKGYATETFVSEEIGKLVIPEVPSMDEYAKKSDLDEYAKKSDIPVIPPLDDYALKSDIPSLDGYAKTTDIPSLDGYALKSDIPSMDNYFTKDEINTMIGDINALIGQATALADTILNA